MLVNRSKKNKGIKNKRSHATKWNLIYDDCHYCCYVELKSIAAAKVHLEEAGSLDCRSGTEQLPDTWIGDCKRTERSRENAVADSGEKFERSATKMCQSCSRNWRSLQFLKFFFLSGLTWKAFPSINSNLKVNNWALFSTWIILKLKNPNKIS